MSERRGSHAAASAHERVFPRQFQNNHRGRPNRLAAGGGRHGRDVRGACTVRCGLKLLASLFVGVQVYFAVDRAATATGSSTPALRKTASSAASSAASSPRADPAASLRSSAVQWLDAHGSSGAGTHANTKLEQPVRGAVTNLAPGLYRDASVGGVYYVAPAQLDAVQR